MTLRGIATGLLALGIAATPVLVSPDASAVALPTLVTTTKKAVYLSPDGDGRHDVARIVFDLEVSAGVTISIRNEGATEFFDPIRLGRLEPGRHSWTFEGRDPEGHAVPDNAYDITIAAQRGKEQTFARVTAFVRTHPDRGSLVASRPVVYPRATAVHDRVLVAYVREDWRALQAVYPAVYGPGMPLRVRLSVLDGKGRTVHRATAREAYTPLLAWDGTRDGIPVPAGTYTLRVSVADRVGFHATYSESVRVSHRQLRAVTTRTTVAADQATDWQPPDPPACLSCGQACGPVASSRFPGGLSFLSCAVSGPTFAFFTMVMPFAAAPVDRYRVAATGGPTDPASGSVALLDDVTVGPGDATAWTRFRPVDFTATPYLPFQATPVRWGFLTHRGSSYDVATFTVEYRHYVPVA